jgi:hypothetical protein
MTDHTAGERRSSGSRVAAPAQPLDGVGPLVAGADEPRWRAGPSTPADRHGRGPTDNRRRQTADGERSTANRTRLRNCHRHGNALLADQTPDLSFNGTDALARFIQGIRAAFLDGSVHVPDLFETKPLFPYA